MDSEPGWLASFINVNGMPINWHWYAGMRRVLATRASDMVTDFFTIYIVPLI